MKRYLPVLLPICCLVSFCFSGLTAADTPKKVVFISGKPSHGYLSHEHRAGNMILAKRLNESGLPVEGVVLPDVGYPKDASVLEDADSIVIFCTGHSGHVLNPHLQDFDILMKKGTGVVMIHWATEAVKGEPGKKFLEWMGGFCDLDWSVNPHWTPTFKPQDHEIWNGVKTFTVHDEWYYHMRFVEDRTGLTPILTDLPPPETLKRKDGSRSGNPDVRRAVAAGETQHVAWAYERQKGKGRGFGFTAGHMHMNWKDDDYRKIMLNAIVWTTGLKVPAKGVPSATPSDKEMHANLDPKRKPKKPAPKPTPKVASSEKPASSYDLQSQPHKPMDSKKSLQLVVSTLGETDNPASQAALLRGILAGLKGQRDVPPPPAWRLARIALAGSGDANVRNLASQLGQVFGDQAAIEQALATLRSNKTPAVERRNALISLVSLRAPELKGLLANLLDDPDLQVDAIRAYVAIEDKDAPRRILGRYAKLSFQAKRAAVETLASRKEYALQLVEALRKKTIPKPDIPVYLARSLSQLLGKRFDDAYGKVQSLSQDKAQVIGKYRQLLTPERLAKADVHKGRQMFEAVCASCHKIYGKGGIIAPDLTGSNRANVEYILLNMIDPSADVPDAYKLVTVHTKDGQILAGTISAEDGQRVVLNTVAQKVTVLKSDIQSRTVSKMSMMPEGLLPALPDDQVLDLVKYLQTKEQVSLP